MKKKEKTKETLIKKSKKKALRSTKNGSQGFSTPNPKKFDGDAPDLYHPPPALDELFREEINFNHDDITRSAFLQKKLKKFDKEGKQVFYEGEGEYNPHFAIVAQNLALLGLKLPQIADVMGYPHELIQLWYDNEPIFKAAYESGGIMADATVARSVYKRAVGYNHIETKVHFNKDGFVTEHEVVKHYPPDATAALTWLKLRQSDKWENIEKVETTHQIMTIAKDEEDL